MGYIAKRGCFIDSPEIVIPVPDFEWTGSSWKVKEEVTYSSVTKQGILELLDEVGKLFPSRSIGEIWLTYYPDLCPLSLMDDWCGYWIEVEASCSEYNVLPFEGGLLDQPQLVIEIFSSIRKGRNSYYIWRSKEDQVA